MKQRIAIIDNYDSFTYNLVTLVYSITGERPYVVRNDRTGIEALDAYDKIICSPGPGVPADAGILLDAIRRYAPTKPLLGICLGHQAIAVAAGGRLNNLTRVYHGVATPVYVTKQDPVFDKTGDSFMAGRYHSWIVDKDALPEELEILAVDDAGHIMALRHRNLPVYGLQFHPESILTPGGAQIVRNWIDLTSSKNDDI